MMLSAWIPKVQKIRVFLSIIVALTSDNVPMCSGCGQGSSGSSRRMSGISNNDSGLFPDSPVSLPLKFNSPRNKLSQSSLVSRASSATKTNYPSVEDLSDFLSKVILTSNWSIMIT